MSVEFYDVKTRQKVKIDDKQVLKTTFTTKNGQSVSKITVAPHSGVLLTG